MDMDSNYMVVSGRFNDIVRPEQQLEFEEKKKE